MALTMVACVDEPMSPMLDDTTLDVQPSPRAIVDGHVHTLREVTGEDAPGELLMDLMVTGLEERRSHGRRSMPSPVGFSMRNIPEVCDGTKALDYEGSHFHEEDCDVLLFVKDQLGGTGALNWDTALPMPEWTGVKLETFGVDKLMLPHLGLDGTIPVELGRLNDLDVLDLHRNELTGPIPSELGAMRELERLVLWGNDLTNSIPPALGRLTRLEYLILSSNELEGEIPPELGSLLSLRVLFLGNNQLSGGIPSALGRSQRLERLSLTRNMLTGAIPPELGSCAAYSTSA